MAAPSSQEAWSDVNIRPNGGFAVTSIGNGGHFATILLDRTGKQERVIDNATCYRSTPTGYTYLIGDAIYINDSKFLTVQGTPSCPVMDGTGSFSSWSHQR